MLLVSQNVKRFFSYEYFVTVARHKSDGDPMRGELSLSSFITTFNVLWVCRFEFRHFSRSANMLPKISSWNCPRLTSRIGFYETLICWLKDICCHQVAWAMIYRCRESWPLFIVMKIRRHSQWLNNNAFDGRSTINCHFEFVCFGFLRSHCGGSDCRKVDLTFWQSEFLTTFICTSLICLHPNRDAALPLSCELSGLFCFVDT